MSSSWLWRVRQRKRVSISEIWIHLMKKVASLWRVSSGNFPEPPKMLRREHTPRNSSNFNKRTLHRFILIHPSLPLSLFLSLSLCFQHAPLIISHQVFSLCFFHKKTIVIASFELRFARNVPSVRPRLWPKEALIYDRLASGSTVQRST